MGEFHLLLHELPPSPADQESVGSHHCGKLTACAGLFQACLDSDAIGRIAIVTPSRYRTQRKERINRYNNGSRIELIDFPSIGQEFTESDRVIVQSFTTSLRPSFHLRWRGGSRNWPVFGINHDLSSPQVFDELLLALMAKPRPFDAIMCSTFCAQRVLQRQLDLAAQLIDSPNTFQLRRVPLGAEVDRFQRHAPSSDNHSLQLPDDRVKFLYFGRISHTLKADLMPLLRAIEQLRDERGAVHLIIAGGVWGETEIRSVERLERFIAERKLRNSISFFPNVSVETRDQLFRAADVFVSPSDSFQESFGLTLVEAMASGLPVIASDFNGYREVLGDSRAGTLIPTTSPPLTNVSEEIPLLDRDANCERLSQTVAIDQLQLVDEMRRLAVDPMRRAEMGENGREHARNRFDWPIVFAQHLSIWRQMLEVAENSPRREARSPCWYDFGDIFREHATRQLTERCWIEKGKEDLPSVLRLAQPHPEISTRILERIVENATRGPLQAVNLGISVEAALIHLSYLMKHGVVRYVERDL